MELFRDVSWAFMSGMVVLSLLRSRSRRRRSRNQTALAVRGLHIVEVHADVLRRAVHGVLHVLQPVVAVRLTNGGETVSGHST